MNRKKYLILITLLLILAIFLSSCSTIINTEEDTVYITNTGAKYHRAGCRYLSKSCISISRSEAIDQGYTPCSVCKP